MTECLGASKPVTCLGLGGLILELSEGGTVLGRTSGPGTHLHQNSLSPGGMAAWVGPLGASCPARHPHHFREP